MRVLVDLPTNTILQVERSPSVGEFTQINGKYPIEAPAGSVPVDSSSYVLPVDGGDFTSLAMQELLARFPMFENIVFNPLLEAGDAADLDPTAVLDNTSNQVISAPYTGSFSPRFQSGRGSGPQTGLAPGSTAVLAPNDQTTPPRPGLIITDTIDISAVVPGGATEFMVYWKFYKYSTTQDIMSEFGIFNGVNSPAVRSLEEVDQEAPEFVVALSIDDGASFVPVGLLEPLNNCAPSTLLRLAFTNTGPDKVYLGAYAVLF